MLRVVKNPHPEGPNQRWVVYDGADPTDRGTFCETRADVNLLLAHIARRARKDHTRGVRTHEDGPEGLKELLRF